MDHATLDIAYKVMSGLGMLATLVVAATALVVAVVLSIRRQCVAAAWILVVGWAGGWLVDVGYLLVGILVTGRFGYVTVQWIFLGLGLVNLFFGVVACVALALFRPGTARGEVERG